MNITSKDEQYLVQIVQMSNI